MGLHIYRKTQVFLSLLHFDKFESKAFFKSIKIPLTLLLLSIFNKLLDHNSDGEGLI